MWLYFVVLWAMMSVLMVLTVHVDLMRALLIHGKIRQDTLIRHSGVLGALMRIEMRKSTWIYFYLVGAIYNLGIALVLFQAPQHPVTQQILAILQSDEGVSTNVRIRPEVIAVIALLGIQDTRRYFESLFITEFGDAKMHCGRFIHYMGYAPSVLSAPQSRTNAKDIGWTAQPILSSAGLFLFSYGSYQQYYHNKILAQQKRANGGKHVLPQGGWFNYILCPLYTTEQIIYLALVLVCGLENPMANLLFGWVALNQSICAYFGKQWYKDKFRSDSKLPRWALFPGVW